MSFSLVWVLLAALTFTPALLRMFGKWAFWPRVARERIAEPPGWISPTRFASRLLGHKRPLRAQRIGVYWRGLREL